MPAAAIDANGDIGLTYIESSATEFMSMWVAVHVAGSASGSYGATLAQGGADTLAVSFRSGDYSTVTVDPNNPNTFWASSEYSPPNSSSNIWATWTASFTAAPPFIADDYAVSLPQGGTLNLATFTPTGGPYNPGDGLIPDIAVYDQNGNLVATGVRGSDGINETLSYVAGATETYYIQVTGDGGTQGEYFLDKTVIPPIVTVTGTVWNDKNDNHVQDGSEPGMPGVAIYVDGVYATSTDSHGNYQVQFYQGNHTITEADQSANGYIETTPGTGVISITPASGLYVTGQNFGNVYVTHSVDNGAADYMESGPNWSTLSAGWNGTSRVHAAISTSTGISAIWGYRSSTFIAQAMYEVYVSFQIDSSRDPNAQYIISDPASMKQYFVYVNQTVTPANGQYGSVGWYDLGAFPLTVDTKHGKSPTVRLHARAGGSVDADGVLFVMLSSGATPHHHAPVTLGTGSAPTAPASASSSSSLLAVLSSTHVNGTTVPFADTTHGSSTGLPAAVNGSASLAAQQANYRQAVDLVLGGHAPSRHQLDGLWNTLEIDPVLANMN
jgi:hypothetical protein